MWPGSTFPPHRQRPRLYVLSGLGLWVMCPMHTARSYMYTHAATHHVTPHAKAHVLTQGIFARANVTASASVTCHESASAPEVHHAHHRACLNVTHLQQLRDTCLAPSSPSPSGRRRSAHILTRLPTRTSVFNHSCLQQFRPHTVTDNNHILTQSQPPP